MAAILIIEPDMHTGHRMSEALTLDEHSCQNVTTVAEGLDIIQHGTRVLTVLNARLPWSDSFSLLHLLEEKGWPVLFVTADAGNVQHLHALYQGSCGVLLSPFSACQLQHAVAELLTQTSRMLTIGSLRLDTESRKATLDGELLTLTAQEFALLHALMQSPDAALTREELLRTAWGYQGIGETRTVDVHIQRLRRKLGSSCIETVYKLGYRLKMA
ncbi:MAG: response regulator transcription factor [Clostridia bacterium]|nr:response regulator transcription factor [Clostridia bacterium]